ncbi:unnamed protein product [Cylicostephanus goldi]|uniref:Uncharacterized protein n=1 Tax=Cylicostephanus goldi TaxID=71465 RepID=A0A3P7QQM7_CYLGO|nr:unnamed protein product [Cylicostephanus goldi]
MPEDRENLSDSEELDSKQVYQAVNILGSRVDKFSGNEEKTFEELLDEYRDIVPRFSIPHPIAKKLLPLYLSGGARFKFQQIPNREKMTWKELVAELAKKVKNNSPLSNI